MANLSFKDFMAVDYTPGMPELISYAAYKRRRGRHDTSGPIEEQTEVDQVDETLDIAQRRKLAVQMKRLAPRMKIARKRALRKTATMPVIKKRTEKSVRNAFFKKLSKGKSRQEVSPTRRKEIEKRLERIKPRIQRMVKLKLKDTRKLDRERKASR